MTGDGSVQEIVRPPEEVETYLPLSDTSSRLQPTINVQTLQSRQMRIIYYTTHDNSPSAEIIMKKTL